MLLGNSALLAQRPTPPKPVAGVEWSDLEVLAASAEARPEPAAAKTGGGLSGKYRALADRAKQFSAQHPHDPRVSQAKQLEVESLLKAALTEGDSQPDRLATLVAEVRKDRRLSSKERIRVVIRADLVRLRPLMDDPAKLALAREQAARSLIQEFPEDQEGYEALLRVADSENDPVRSATLAREVMTSPAPAGLKAAARLRVERLELLGRSIEGLVTPVLGRDNPFTAAAGRPVVLYTWAEWSPGSLGHAKALPAIVPAGTAFVGINLDQDVAAAKTRAEQAQLPGQQIYDPRGLESDLAKTLKLSALITVYVVSARGKVSEISAERRELLIKALGPVAGRD